ncbi:hypothetical protein SLE2022_175500 [Rubroshorea leprosula]
MKSRSQARIKEEGFPVLGQNYTIENDSIFQIRLKSHNIKCMGAHHLVNGMLWQLRVFVEKKCGRACLQYLLQ